MKLSLLNLQCSQACRSGPFSTMSGSVQTYSYPCSAFGSGQDRAGSRIQGLGSISSGKKSAAMNETKFTPGLTWTLQTVQTVVGSCHKIGPFPGPMNRPETHACVYSDNINPDDADRGDPPRRRTSG